MSANEMFMLKTLINLYVRTNYGNSGHFCYWYRLGIDSIDWYCILEDALKVY